MSPPTNETMSNNLEVMTIQKCKYISSIFGNHTYTTLSLALTITAYKNKTKLTDEETSENSMAVKKQKKTT